MARLLGAQVNEVAVMQTLTANLHLLLATFYRPTSERHKIILESKAFPSDHYAIESHIKHHHFDPRDSMVCIEPPAGTSVIPTSHILDTIRHHAASTALVLLPGIQFYSGQLLDIPTITRAVHGLGIPIGWDLAHAVGNVPLELHAWNVDFACWCMYKYLNCGPGCSGGLFVHKDHSTVSSPSESNSRTLNDDPRQRGKEEGTFRLSRTAQEQQQGYLNRLSGWWGSSKPSRFQMANQFEPIPGAAGWQLSNPSVLDMTSVQAALAVFEKTSMVGLRAKSVRLTGWLEELLERSPAYTSTPESLATGLKREKKLFGIITPRDPEQRGAQLSILLADGLLDPVMEVLEEEACVVDERRPNVIRVAPTPLYNTFEDVRRFVVVFQGALERAVEARKNVNENGNARGSLMVHGGEDSKGWSEIK